MDVHITAKNYIIVSIHVLKLNFQVFFHMLVPFSFSSYFATNNTVWLLLSLSHLHCLYLLVAAVPGDESAVFSSRQQRAIPQHAQSKDAALMSSLDDMADAISACVTEMG